MAEVPLLHSRLNQQSSQDLVGIHQGCGSEHPNICVGVLLSDPNRLQIQPFKKTLKKVVLAILVSPLKLGNPKNPDLSSYITSTPIGFGGMSSESCIWSSKGAMSSAGVLNILESVCWYSMVNLGWPPILGVSLSSYCLLDPIVFSTIQVLDCLLYRL